MSSFKIECVVRPVTLERNKVTEELLSVTTWRNIIIFNVLHFYLFTKFITEFITFVVKLCFH